ncbi:MAG: hypothetical protein ACK5L5_03510 [Bacteroidales bacterium]
MTTKRTVIISTENVNSYGFWTLTEGIDTSQFERNPILLWMHNRPWRGTKDEVLALGTVANLRKEDNKLLGDLVFDEKDDFAKELARKWDAGVYKMVSPGLIALETSNSSNLIKQGQRRETVIKSKLVELSIVDIGSNDDALSLAVALYDDTGMIKLQTGADCPIKLLDTNSNNNYMSKEVLTLADGRQFTSADVLTLVNEGNAKDKAITELNAKVDSLEKKNGEFRDAEAKRLHQLSVQIVDAGIKSGKINTDADNSLRDKWIDMFDKDFESTKLAWDSIPERKPVHSNIEDGEGTSERDELAKLSWDEIDRSGKQGVLKEKYNDLYVLKFEERFGVKPSNK